MSIKMKTARFLSLLGCGALALLLVAPPLSAAPRHRKEPAPLEEEEAQTMPSPSRRRAAAKPAETTDPAEPATAPKTPTGAAATSSIEPAELADFDQQPGPIRRLLTAALDLTKRNLTYTYGSADPASGGLDCSGTVFYLLNAAGFKDVPRDASGQYSWVRRQARFYAVLSKKAENPELAELRPGDLMFWSGTYNVDRDPPVTHTMIYLGRRKSDGKRLMFGASDGRPYDGQRRNGVSVFDFKMPAARSGDKADAETAAAPDRSPDFAGYGPIPGMADLKDEAARQEITPSGEGKRMGTQRREGEEKRGEEAKQ